MTTPAKLAACAANAQHSTGPRSPEGKAVSSRNALKFGLFAQAQFLPGEDPAEFDQLIREYEDYYGPRSPSETRLVHDLVRALWLERRYTRIEAEVIEIRFAALPPEERAHGLGAIYIQDAEGANVLQKIERSRTAAQRQVQRVLKEIRELGMDYAYLPAAPAPSTASYIAPAAAEPAPAPESLSPSVRFDTYPANGPTPARTPRDSWDNPALRL